MNRRLLYNRASADPEGRPWSERKRYVWWDEEKQRWTGHDVPDFIADRPPSYRPAPGTARHRQHRRQRSVHHAGGREGLALRALRPPRRTAARRTTSRRSRSSRTRSTGSSATRRGMEWHRRDNPYHRAWGDPRFPYVLTTYRLTEHHTAGGMSRWLSWLSELQPEMFCEVSRELAAEKGLRNGGWATITTARGEIECRVLVTERLRPLRVRGRTVHTIGLALPLELRRPRDAAIPPTSSSRSSPTRTSRSRSRRRSPANPRRTAQLRAALGDDGSSCGSPSRLGEAPRDCRALQPRTGSRPSSRRGRPCRQHPDDVAVRAARAPEREPASARRKKWASSPTRRSASAARRARSRASSGTSSPTTASSSPG